MPQISDSLVGWSIGYTYTEAKKRENEIKQGKNFYLSAMTITVQMSQLATLVSKINQILPPHPLKTPVNILCNVGSIASLPAVLFCAAVKQGDYENLVELYHQSKYAYIQLPEKLNSRTVKLFCFLAEHSGDMIRVAMIAASIALIALGNRAYGAAVLTALAYDVMDQMGFVPRRISLFIEIYMPTVSLVGSIIGGIALVRVIAAVALSTRIIPSLSITLHQKIDSLIRHFFNIKGPSLKEIDAPLMKQEKMTFDEIQAILDSHSFDVDYTVNPAHCSKFTINLNELPSDNDFDKFLSFFDDIDWQSKYNLVKNKLKDDDRFIDFLFEKYPEVNKEDLACDIENYIEKLAEPEGVSPEEYAANWMREQMAQLVEVLNGKNRIEGLQQDLDEAIQVCAVLLPYLSSLEDQIELEDALLKLSIEAGDYCGRGVKRAANELIWGILQNEIDQEEGESDPIKSYEMKFSQALQNQRHQVIEGVYDEFAKQFTIPDDISKDIHGFDAYRLFFSLGFFPLTQFERRRLGIMEIACWELYAEIREHLYDQYRSELNDVVKEVGEAEFGVYLLKMINENERLSDQEKEEILEKFTERNNGQWSYEETLERFHRLLFVRLGVLIPVT